MISVVIPFHNEKENLPELIPSLEAELQKLGSYEIILVDDGSTDSYHETLKSFLHKEKVQLVKMGRQMGKGRALNVGLNKTSGEYIVFMDADLQDDPADLKAFKEKIDEGFDLVNGFRHNRKDNPVIKVYSKTAGWFLKSYLNSPFSDINCGFKMFRKELLEDLPIYGNNFRFFPLAAFYEGYKVSEVKVNNKPRIHGKSKFGMSKLFIGMIDMLSAYFLYKFAEKPLHFFGMIGAGLLLIGGITMLVITYQRVFMDMLLYRRPAFQYASLFIILGFQVIMTGILGELLVFLHKKQK
jgi:glycosyltransferase involved in cell wall biosynthesis